MIVRVTDDCAVNLSGSFRLWRDASRVCGAWGEGYGGGAVLYDGDEEKARRVFEALLDAREEGTALFDMRSFLPFLTKVMDEENERKAARVTGALRMKAPA